MGSALVGGGGVDACRAASSSSGLGEGGECGGMMQRVVLLAGSRGSGVVRCTGMVRFDVSVVGRGGDDVPVWVCAGSGGGERAVEANSGGCGPCVVGATGGFCWGGAGVWGRGPCVGVLVGAEERREEAKGQVREGRAERSGIVPNSIHSRSEGWKESTAGCCKG